MKQKDISTIVIGGINIDQFILGFDNINIKKEVNFFNDFEIYAGGKGKNIASMIANLQYRKKVAFIGKIAKDKFNFWKIPLDELNKNKVNVDFVQYGKFNSNKDLLGIAQILVDRLGNNKINVFKGQNEKFNSKDINNSTRLFEIVAKNKGSCIITLEIPKKTVIHSINKASKLGLKNILELGGIYEGEDYSDLFRNKIYLVKGNLEEIKQITNINVTNINLAKKAANYFLNKNAENVVITAGARGVYLVNSNEVKYFKVPKLNLNSKNLNSAGCGDQFLAALVVFLEEGNSIEKSIELAQIVSNLQYHKSEIVPIKRKEVNKYLVNK